jgi:hypothetical protein
LLPHFVGDLELLIKVFLQFLSLTLQHLVPLLFLQQPPLLLLLLSVDGSQLPILDVQVGIGQIPIGLEIALNFLLVFVFDDVLVELHLSDCLCGF